MALPLFNLVLINPEIPNNTGNIGRTAMATGCRLHIVRPIGFDMSEKARRRAGLDYWHLVDCVEHESWEAFVEREGFAERGEETERRRDEVIGAESKRNENPSTINEQRTTNSLRHTLTPDPSPRGRGGLWLYTTKSMRPHWEANFARGDYLLFGRETKGAPAHVHDWVAKEYGRDHLITLPMVEIPEARSLNLATAVCAAVYEGMRQVQGSIEE